ncbi:MarR family transcriptional regulator [Lacihabitans sp. LS3-19]|uniref:MarR family winged helix-turn-helix transcriptional regulator n=1 Tax=Lacihabitans sp. LS3-19 TaxID=2487335 RepID=UPI0020CD0165|nr:MarR family transcriptional regulator [Lacihabitans sp. LS3-19]MCP9767728.1 MarR family transcriptional regulator [Lacihabitans sp. LS3-19]
MTHSDKRAYFFKIDSTIKRIRSFMQKNLSDGGIDLTVDQWVVLDHILPHPGISQNELGALTYKDAPTVTRILDILVKKNLIIRKMSDADRRKFILELTSTGLELHKKAFAIIAKSRKKSYENLSDKDYEDLVRIMDTIYANVD